MDLTRRARRESLNDDNHDIFIQFLLLIFYENAFNCRKWESDAGTFMGLCLLSFGLFFLVSRVVAPQKGFEQISFSN